MTDASKMFLDAARRANERVADQWDQVIAAMPAPAPAPDSGPDEPCPECLSNGSCDCAQAAAEFMPKDRPQHTRR